MLNIFFLLGYEVDLFYFWFLINILSVCQNSYSLRRMETERERKRRIKRERVERENSHDCRLEYPPGSLFIQRNKIWKPAKQRLFYFVAHVSGLFQLHHQINYPYSHRSRIQNHLLCKGPVDTKWVECDFQFEASSMWGGLFPAAPLKVSLCKPSSSLKVHMTFFSQRFSSLCSCKVVGYCSMKLNNNCNCTFFPEDFKYWRYSLNAFIQTCLWLLVHLSRASNNLKRANFSLWTFRGHVG